MASSRPPYPLVNLANAFLAGPWTASELVVRGKRASPHNGTWIRKLVRVVLKVYEKQPPAFDALLDFLLSHPIASQSKDVLQIGEHFWQAATMQPRGEAASKWQVPAIATPAQLAAWLELSISQLDWLADIRGWTARLPNQKLRHYNYHWQPRGRGRFRLIESPKRRLKAIQRKILHEILDHIPPHAAVHGFRPGRSIFSYVSPHVGRRIVLRFDLHDFFPSIRRSRIHGLFRTVGYPDTVAHLLSGLCTSRVPLEVWKKRPDPRDADKLWNYFRGPHLSQGAPTSPALANLCAYGLDVRLSGLAHSAEVNYTRYADDLAFSGDGRLERSARRFQVAVAVIAAEEGFDFHFRKSGFMRRSVCQQLGGVVVNERPNIRRAVYDNLKAILTNCIRHGSHSQNRKGHSDFRSHLLGRIAHVQMIHHEHGKKLRALFDRIIWS
jgi:hypothetical protein